MDLPQIYRGQAHLETNLAGMRMAGGDGRLGLRRDKLDLAEAAVFGQVGYQDHYTKKEEQAPHRDALSRDKPGVGRLQAGAGGAGSEITNSYAK
jgi:hypothetical protein